jgi:hypothetical protein
MLREMTLHNTDGAGDQHEQLLRVPSGHWGYATENSCGKVVPATTIMCRFRSYRGRLQYMYIHFD